MPQKHNQKILIAHIHIYGKLKKEINNGNIVEIHTMKEILRRTIHIPERDKWLFINEMQQMGLIKKLSRDKWELCTISLKNKPKDCFGNPLW